MAFLEATPFFTAWLFLIRYHFFCNFIPKASLWPALGISFNLSFSLPQREEYYEGEDFNDLFSYMGSK